MARSARLRLLQAEAALLNLVGIVALLCSLGMLSALTYGSVAALLAEMFPARIRYSSMSIPYHIGAGFSAGSCR